MERDSIDETYVGCLLIEIGSGILCGVVYLITPIYEDMMEQRSAERLVLKCLDDGTARTYVYLFEKTGLS